MSLPTPAVADLSATLGDLEQTPLFMQNLPDEDNDELEAIRALQYDGTPLENAQNFKAQGNELVAVAQWIDAREMYSKALSVLQQAPTEHHLRETCHVNRALCQLKLKNYRSTIHDCAAALRLNATNIKALYRSAEALLALDKFEETLDACNRALATDATNVAVRQVQAKAQSRLTHQHEINARKKAESLRKEQAKKLLQTALAARGIRTMSHGRPPEMEDAHIHLTPDPLSPQSTLVFPVILLYPLDAQSDFVKAFAETDSVATHFQYILPLPWDTQRRYESIECFVETSSKGLLKVGRNTPLLRILSNDAVVVVNELVAINVLPKVEAAAWVAKMKLRHST